MPDRPDPPHRERHRDVVTGLRWSVRAIVCVLIGVACLAVGVAVAVVMLVGLAVTGQLLAWWIS